MVLDFLAVSRRGFCVGRNSLPVNYIYRAPAVRNLKGGGDRPCPQEACDQRSACTVNPLPLTVMFGMGEDSAILTAQSEPPYSKCMSWTSSTSISGEPVKHAESGTPPADPQSQNLHLTKPQDDSCAHSSVRSTRRTVEVLNLKYFARGKPSGLVI